MRFHLVKSNDPEKVGKYIMPCPADKRDDGASIRHFIDKGIICTNFKGSAHALDPKKYHINWIRGIEPGVDVGFIQGVHL